MGRPNLLNNDSSDSNEFEQLRPGSDSPKILLGMSNQTESIQVVQAMLVGHYYHESGWIVSWVK